jgi:predicted TPR repeat methyltransferase
MVRTDTKIVTYDEEAEASGWYGPEVAFGLAFKHVMPGQSILDIGIGTGLGAVLFRKAGLDVHGMDISSQMLDVSRSKGFGSLRRHDLRKLPYPYESESMHHAICTGVFNFISDLSPVFEETARILRKKGIFVFVYGDITEKVAHEFQVRAKRTKPEKMVTMYRHSQKQIDTLMETFGFVLLKSLTFTVFMDRERTKSIQAKAYLARKATLN